MSIAEREGMGWEVQSRLLAWRDRELAWACRRYRAVGQATLEVLLDRAADAVVANVGASVAAGGRPPGDRDLRALWRKAFREQVKCFLRTEAARRSVDVFDAACETVAGVSGAGVERVVALEAVQIECEFESSLSERERRVLLLRRAGASAIDIRRELSIDRRQVAALDYALDAKRQLFEHELATGELCRVRQRFIARLATGDGGLSLSGFD